MDSDDEGPNGSYDDSNRVFLQAFFARQCINLEDGKQLLAEIMSIQQDKNITPDQVTDADFSAYIQAARDALTPYDYEIKATQHQRTQIRYWAIVNSTADQVIQIATTHNAEEIGYIRRMLDAMFDTYNRQTREIMAVRAMQAVGRKILKPANDDRRDSGEGTADKGLTVSEAERCLATLVKEGWFEKSREFYTLSPRALMELKEWLKETYNDPEATADEWQPIKNCQACKEIVTTGMRCSNMECNFRLHDICDGFFARRPEKKCPKCKTEWDGSGLVGQKVVQALEERMNGRRKSGGAAAARRAREQSVQEEVKEDEGEEEEEEVNDHAEENDEVDGQGDSDDK